MIGGTEVQSSANPKALRSPKQILHQDICHKYGWSCTIIVSKNPFQIREKEDLVSVKDQDQVGTIFISDLNQAQTTNNL